MLTHISCYDDEWNYSSSEQRDEVREWLLKHDQLPDNVHTITLQLEGESATALIEGYVRDDQGRLILDRCDPRCAAGHALPECQCTVETTALLIRCKTLPPFTRWPSMG